MTDVEYLTLDDVFVLIEALRVGPIRDVGLLDSAMARPRSSAFGEDAYASLELKAAALLHSLVKNHALLDGNKRVAWLAVTVFARINNHGCRISDEHAFSLVWDVAAGEVELSTIATRLNLSPLE